MCLQSSWFVRTSGHIWQMSLAPSIQTNSERTTIIYLWRDGFQFDDWQKYFFQSGFKKSHAHISLFWLVVVPVWRCIQGHLDRLTKRFTKSFLKHFFSSLHWTEKLCFKLGRLQINFDWFRESHKFKLFTSRLITQRVFSNDSGSSQLGLDICKVLLTEHLWPTRQYYQRSDLWTSCDHC